MAAVLMMQHSFSEYKELFYRFELNLVEEGNAWLANQNTVDRPPTDETNEENFFNHALVQFGQQR